MKQWLIFLWCEITGHPLESTGWLQAKCTRCGLKMHGNIVTLKEDEE